MSISTTRAIFFLFLSSFCLQSCSDDKFKTAKEQHLEYRKDSLVYLTKEGALGNESACCINMGYRDYPFREDCQKAITITLNRDDSLINQVIKSDTLQIAKEISFFFKRQGCVHFIGQVLTDTRLTIYFYAENEMHVMNLSDYVPYPHEFLADFSDDQWKLFRELSNFASAN